jgi:hypothetical protein
MTGMRRVAITGIGAVSSLGVGVTAFWDGLLAARSGVRRITSFDPGGLTVQIAAETAGSIPRHLPDSKLDLLDRFAQVALVASAEAWRDAGSISPTRIATAPVFPSAAAWSRADLRCPMPAGLWRPGAPPAPVYSPQGDAERRHVASEHDAGAPRPCLQPLDRLCGGIARDR